MYRPFRFRSVSLGVAIAALTGLTACGGGSDSPPPAEVTGTAAVGAPLAGATVVMTCADGRTITAASNAAGVYAIPAGSFRLPCIGQATKTPTALRGVLFSGTVANFTPLTDMLVEVMLAAAAPGDPSMTLTEFIARIRTDATFAANVSSPAAVARYRNATVEVVRERLRAAGLSQALLGAMLNANFESALFSANPNDPLDKLLENLKIVLQDPNGNVLAAVLTAAAAAGDLLPPPAVTPTGTGSTGT